MSETYAKADISSITGGYGKEGKKLIGPRYWLKQEILRQLYNSIDERKILCQN